MTDLTHTLSTLRRPRLLIRAARFGMAGYDRRRDLRRLAQGDVPREGDGVLRRLLALEADLEHSRQAGETTYSPTRHVALLIALMAEARAWLNGMAAA